ncbi:hypothetical protein HUT03_00470 [Candidatus Liberibacter africanus]|uniref:Lipoprotein n=1 Tax=Candidatus Liberibacter africanus PTSAPSY TaxID=1277257 RepID=A0A0G3I3C4_LIBAF|nr:hypothetical protein [Candidatus Liberibacter africanus]AKK19750.1 hypothetical protein G293_00510 [Candidatus Liberibacter africanus PTSAPSY]QTP63629.1 hypothetical protein HUT03_00470 [Candidatus Liberibacter africanus]
MQLKKIIIPTFIILLSGCAEEKTMNDINEFISNIEKHTKFRIDSLNSKNDLINNEIRRITIYNTNNGKFMRKLYEKMQEYTKILTNSIQTLTDDYQTIYSHAKELNEDKITIDTVNKFITFGNDMESYTEFMESTRKFKPERNTADDLINNTYSSAETAKVGSRWSKIV